MIQIDKIRNIRELCLISLSDGVIMIGFGYPSCSVLTVSLYDVGLLVWAHVGRVLLIDGFIFT